MLCCEKFYFRHESFPFGIRHFPFLSLWNFFFLRETFSFSVQWDFFFPRDTFSFSMSYFLSMRDFFFLVWNFYFICQTFSFRVRPFFSPRDFSFPRETFLVRMVPLKIFLPKVNISGQPYKKDLASYVDCV